MPRIKICGITNLEDALCAAEAGADALGFVFYKGSSRYICPEKVRDITAALPPFVVTVGLFVNAGSEMIEQVMHTAGLGVVQLHGDETPEDCVLAPYPVIKAIRVKDAGSLTEAENFQVSALLLDAWSDQHYGGTGESFDWQLAKKLTGRRPLILAGGLNPENVAGAIRTVNPYAVDVSSGVEKSPGHKDHDKVYKFIQQVREA
ncbi:phosphoribosylanthranilate isomerase [uncultured Desulfuromusa sp.]|uniref:phosphoribosylanthranilate isomerase n=1 Tax=uncultured Desulfuromusa sp. TaxID=219183 RepID=UPI002AA75168|nr:phosphoribosylanthranilate isomerase [uncultured Desulfuromusa sp.]